MNPRFFDNAFSNMPPRIVTQTNSPAATCTIESTSGSFSTIQSSSPTNTPFIMTGKSEAVK